MDNESPEPLKPGSKSDTLHFTSRVLLVVGILVIALLIFLLFWYAIHVVFIGFLGVILAVFLRGLSDWLAKITRLSNGWSLAIVIVCFFGGIGIGFLLIIPHMVSQIEALQENLISSWSQIRRSIEQLPLGKDLIDQLPKASQVGLTQGLAHKAQVFFKVTFEMVTDFVVLLFVGIFLAANPDIYINGFIRLFPIEHRSRTKHILGEVGNTLRWWLVGIFFDMALVGVLTGIGLWVLKVPLALILAIISGLLTFIPTLGLLISLIPAGLVAVTGGIGKLVSVIILYLVAHALEAYAAGPLVQQKAVSLPPALTIMALFVFGELFGVLGLIVAAPLTAVCLVVVKILYVEHVLGDRVKKPREPHKGKAPPSKEK